MNLEELNPSQREAVMCTDAPSLVIAGAGSGKTRVLTYKVAYLLEQGMQPWNILALTFTNKAAREMRERVATLVSPQKAAALWMGTFHSVFARILRIEGHRLGFDANFTIYDTRDSESLIRLIIREMGLDEKVYKPSAIQNRISAAKNHLVLPTAYRSVREFRDADEVTKRTLTPEIYSLYVERCRLSGAVDFDDLLLCTWLLFERFPEVRAHWQDRFHFVLVDEYQDTNYAQHQIIRQLTDQRQRVCVVGDDAQSIYSFRGANIDNILHFQETYSGAHLFKLERNYRSTQTIVNAAGSLIRSNRGQIPKNVYSEKEVGSPLSLFSAYSDIDEANIILREVERAHRAGIPYGDIAILYRTNAQSRKIEESFLHGRVPYHIYAGMSFYQREEIKDMLCYLRLALNPQDEESLRRVINKPARGIGDTTLLRLLTAAHEGGTSAWEVLQAGSCPGVNAGAQARLKAFHDMIAGFHASATSEDAYTLALQIATESGLRDYVFSGHEPEDVSRQENLQELMDSISAFVSDNREQGRGTLLTDYLQEASLATDFEVSPADTDDDCVSLMTVHSAKGLEFPVVFITGMEEGLFPSEMSSDSPRALEEERRLFYVALTRAERQVVLTYAKSRFRNGKVEYARPSRFLNEIPQNFFQKKPLPNLPQRGRDQPLPSPLQRRGSSSPLGGGQVGAFSKGEGVPPPLGEVRKGLHVLHERFGRGEVLGVEGSGIDAKATVRFDNAGTKVLMLRFAKLTVLQ